MKLNLESLALSSKTAEFDFPGIPGFKVQLTYLSRMARRKLQEKCKVQKFDEHSGAPYMDIDTEKWRDEYAKHTITGWSGLTLNKVAQLMLIDTDKVDNPDEEIEFDLDTAKQLLKLSDRFDSWVTLKLDQLDNFRS
ncbi:hypothetical protein AEO54_285 [Vibrio phage vB_VorS-PVo5]|nr:hypothetical protein AEO54_285 [Vibrio phage vB_VorS-PVo5]